MADELAPVSGLDPTPDELLAYFVSLVGVDRLEPVLALLEPEEAFEVRKVASMKIPPRVIGVARAMVLGRIRNSAGSRRRRELRVQNGWLV